LYGDDGIDLVRGAGGNDSLDGGGSSVDTLYGYGGADTLRDVSGNYDILQGGDGNDHLYSRDEPAWPYGDAVTGGAGTDTCVVDANESVSSYEF
jgi:Ca2+-binding RTX toxin-like protein